MSDATSLTPLSPDLSETLFLEKQILSVEKYSPKGQENKM